MMMDQPKGIESLKAAVQRDCEKDENCFNPNGCHRITHEKRADGLYSVVKCFHLYCNKYKWIMDRAADYARVLDVSHEDVIAAWENERNYWYMNFYQDCNQPPLADANGVRVFDSVAHLFSTFTPQNGFRCPACNGVSEDAYTCTCAGCDWKAYGLLGTMGKGVTIIVKDTIRKNHIFKPLDWETEEERNQLTNGSAKRKARSKAKN